MSSITYLDMAKARAAKMTALNNLHNKIVNAVAKTALDHPELTADDIAGYFSNGAQGWTINTSLRWEEYCGQWIDTSHNETR